MVTFEVINYIQDPLKHFTMKTKLLVALLVMCGMAKADSWTSKASYGGTKRKQSVSFSIGTKGYIGTGYLQSGKQKDFWEWDQATNVWTQKANFGGTARAGAVGFSIGTMGYIGTGQDNDSLRSDFWEWDQGTNVWTLKANFKGTARSGAVGFSIGTKGYFGTGSDGANKQDFWEWNQTTNTWTQKAIFGGTARYGAVGFSIGTKGYIGTGTDGTNQQDFWEWDQALDTWTQKANFGGSARSYAVGFSIGTKGYLGTGYDGAYKNDFWQWDQSNNTWIQKANFIGAAIDEAACFSIGSYGYVGTGYTGAAQTATFYEYNPITITVTPTNVSCYGMGNGVATPNVTGGATPYSYSWNTTPAQTNAIATGLPPGNYTLTVTDANSAIKTATVAITQPSVLAVAISPVNSSCNNSGIASAMVTGGTTPYSYSWSNGQTTSAATGLNIGSYTLTTTDSQSCVATQTVSIMNSPLTTPTICTVTVDSLSQYNVIIWDKTPFAGGVVDSFIIYRDTANNNYAPIGKVAYTSLSEFIDTARTLYPSNGDPNVSSWRYKIAAMDTCGDVSMKSPYHQTIFIQNVIGNFSWNQYQIEGQAIPVPPLNNYLFLRDDLSSGNYVTIQSLSASSTAYTDPAYSTYQTTGTWRVKTNWSISCTPTIKNPVPMGSVNATRSNTFKATSPTSINETSLETLVSVYPNPASENLSINFNTTKDQKILIQVVNTLGQAIRSVDLGIIPAGNSLRTLNIAEIPHGIYCFKVSGHNFVSNQVVIIGK